MSVTKEVMSRVVPSGYKGGLTDEMMDNINALIDDENFRELYKENLVDWTSVLQGGNYQMSKYVEAVKFVSHKLTGSSDIEAYTKTFPDRYQRLVDEGASSKTISSYVSAYKSNKLVTQILEQTMVPTHILNAGLFQKAINQQAYLMMHGSSDKVKSDAAACLIKELKAPETKKLELDIGVKDDGSLKDLRQATQDLVAMQREMLENKNMTPQEIAHSKLAQQEIEDVG